MLKLMLVFVCYFRTSKNHLISSAFKFAFFSFGGLCIPNPPPGVPPPPTAAALAPGFNFLLHN